MFKGDDAADKKAGFLAAYGPGTGEHETTLTLNQPIPTPIPTTGPEGEAYDSFYVVDPNDNTKIIFNGAYSGNGLLSTRTFTVTYTDNVGDGSAGSAVVKSKSVIMHLKEQGVGTGQYLDEDWIYNPHKELNEQVLGDFNGPTYSLSITDPAPEPEPEPEGGGSGNWSSTYDTDNSNNALVVFNVPNSIYTAAGSGTLTSANILDNFYFNQSLPELASTTLGIDKNYIQAMGQYTQDTIYINFQAPVGSTRTDIDLANEVKAIIDTGVGFSFDYTP